MNYVWVGLWFGIVATNALLVALEYTLEKHLADPLAYSARMTSVSAQLDMCLRSNKDIGTFCLFTCLLIVYSLDISMYRQTSTAPC